MIDDDDASMERAPVQGGMYVFQLFNVFGSSDLVLLWIIFFESVAIAWVFGVDRFYDGLNDMLGFRPSRWFKFCWLFFTPLICAVRHLFHSFPHCFPLNKNASSDVDSRTCDCLPINRQSVNSHSYDCLLINRKAVGRQSQQ